MNGQTLSVNSNSSVSNEYANVYNYAVKLLSARSHTVFELQRKLVRKNYPQALVKDVIDDLKKKKYLDDAEFASVFANNLSKYKSFGYHLAKAKLKARGLDSQTVDQALELFFTIDRELQIAAKLVQKKDKGDKMKTAAMLQRKGFRSEVISKIVFGG